MPRSSQQITQKEADTYQKFCSEHRIIADETEAGLSNGNLIGEYIAITWDQDITDHTLSVALEKLRDRIVFYSPAQAAYLEIAKQDPTRANALSDWIHSTANTVLVNNGDDGFENEAALLIELKGREITQRQIQEAIGRISYKRGRLHYTPVPKSADPRRHPDDGQGFMPKDQDQSKKYRGGKKNHASEEPRTVTPIKDMDPTEAKWRDMALSLRGNTHSETAALEQIVGPNWRRTFELRKQYLNRNVAISNRMGAA